MQRKEEGKDGGAAGTLPAKVSGQSDCRPLRMLSTDCCGLMLPAPQLFLSSSPQPGPLGTG